MNNARLSLLAVALVASNLHIAHAGTVSKAVDCGERPPPVKKVQAPRTPMIFVSKEGTDRQALSLFYRRSGSVDFEYHRTGGCERQEKGTAVLKPCWWLGSESEDNEQGEAYWVQEYVYEDSRGCTMYLRIAEDDWRAAKVGDSGCSKTCPAAPAEMHLQKK